MWCEGPSTNQPLIIIILLLEYSTCAVSSVALGSVCSSKALLQTKATVMKKFVLSFPLLVPIASMKVTIHYTHKLWSV